MRHVAVASSELRESVSVHSLDELSGLRCSLVSVRTPVLKEPSLYRVATYACGAAQHAGDSMGGAHFLIDQRT
jgi:hypothetical protein